MPLEDLLETIETLRGRIAAHGPLLSQNEIRTRYALIDPLLRALGWDVADPVEVVPEQDASGGRADYALLDAEGKPAVMVEAKKLERSLRDGLDQAIAYCVGKGTPYFCVTDGDTWEVYETFRMVPTSEKVITQFKVTRDKPAEVCLKALALWRPSVAEGSVTEGNKPVVSPPLTKDPPPPAQRKPPVVTDQVQGGLNLQALAVSGGMAPPTSLHFPYGGSAEVGKWVNLPWEVARWLQANGKLGEEQCPLLLFEKSKRYLVASEPHHPTGKSFALPKRVGPLWLEANYNPQDSLRNARFLVEQCGMDPADFRVRLAD